VQPAKLQSLLQAALAHHRAGRLPEAELLYRQARAAAPKNFDVLHLSGLAAYQQGRIADAVTWLGRAHKLDPRHAVCEMRYALALLAAKQTAEAEKHFRHTVATKPDLPEAWDNLAYCLKTQDRLAEAIVCHEKAVGLKPDYATGWFNFGLTLSVFGRVHEALACHERALAADPGYAMARFGRAQALQQLHRIPEAVADYDAFLRVQPRHLEAHSYRLFALHNLEELTREQLFAEHAAYGRVIGAAPPVDFAAVPDPGRRLRVAILSPDLRAHSCAYFIEPLLQHLDRERFELYLYHDHFREDAVSARLKTLAAVWRNFCGQPAAVVEQAIRADAPDILIDLAGHTAMTSRLPLFGRRLAPVQVTYLGYPDTTGVPAMDFRFTDALADPPGDADAFATEHLVRFAPTAWCYAPPGDAPELAPAPCLARGHVTFGCYNNLAKITDRMLAVWAAVLAEVPASRLRLKGRGLSDAAVQARYRERFARAGLPAERVDLLERTAETASHLALYNEVDIAFDTFPYHGTTTTCEALWMGVPVVSLVGDRHVARVGASLLAAVGHAEWAVPTPEAYVRQAVALARDPAALAQLRAGLRREMSRSPLLEHAGQAARFGAALRECWAHWCQSRSPALQGAAA
jgi:predicted O-linked N-acetylglucosamine transferase (SPINDLY family)